MKMNDNIFKKIDSAMLSQLDELERSDINSKDFAKVQTKARTIVLVADKIIQSQIAQLKNDIWTHSKRYNSYRESNKINSSYIEIEENNNLPE